MLDRWTRPGIVERGALPTPEQATALYAKLAGEVLKGFSKFDGMEEAAQGKLVADTAYVIAGIEFNYGGQLRTASPEAAWSALIQGHPERTANRSATGRFIRTLGKSARGAYFTAFAMLEAGVSTRAELAKVGKPPPDRLFGVRSGLKGARKDIDVPPSTADLLELPIEMPAIILEREEE